MQWLPVSSTSTPTEGRRHDVQGLRGIAVLTVIAFHGGLPGFPGGFVGVDVFFVISGFVITRLICREISVSGSLNLLRFYQDRIKRIIPALVTTLAVSVIAGFLLFSPAHFHDLCASAAMAALGFSNVYFWQTSGYFEIASEFKPLLHTWSLGVEQQFYLVWPILLLVVIRLPRWMTASLLVSVGLISLLLNVKYQPDTSIFYLSWFRVFEFMIGAAVFRLQSSKFSVLSNATGILGMLLVGWAVFTFNSAMIFPSTSALVPCLGTALLIFSGERSLVGRVLTSRPLKTIGDMSYSLYLVHWPVLVFWRYAKFDELSYLDLALAIALTFVLSWGLYQLVEIKHRADRTKSVRAEVAGARLWVGAALAIAAIAAVPWANGGWQFRAGFTQLEYPALAAMGEVAFRELEYGGAGTQPKFVQRPSRPTLMLAGDSHARQYFSGIDAILPPEHNIEVLDQGSCIFRVTRCADFDATVTEYLEAVPDGPLVISQRWDFDKHISLHFGRNAGAKITPEVLADFYAGRIAALFKIYPLTAANRILIMGSAPEVATFGDVATCLLRPAYLSHPELCQTSDASSPPIAFRRAFNLLLSMRIDELNRLHGGNIRFADPFSVLCRQLTCAQVLNGSILYNDHDHLSIDGAKLVMSRFADELLEEPAATAIVAPPAVTHS